MKLWQKDYSLNSEIEKFTVGNDYIIDRKLIKYDVQGSLAHAKMLNKIGILTDSEHKKISAALKEIIELDKSGKFEIKVEDEDCHTAIENYLVKKLGNTGKKIHTARSRNDQVLTALRLYYKDELKNILELSENFIESLKKFSKGYGAIKIPGYTHMRKAMPSSICLWVGSFIESMNDNKFLIESTAKLIDQSPLGTGAGYGLPIKVDRKLTAAELGFSRIQENPIYAQNSRGKFESIILNLMTQLMCDLNKISSDLILFSMDEFGFFVLPKEFCTGSSIMPHKKNPDVLEIVRAKYSIVLGYEFQVKSMIANLPSGYNRDLQLAKEAVMSAIDATKDCMKIMSLLVSNLKADKEKCENAMTKELFSVNEIMNLVGNGTPFRDAYKIVSKKYK